MADRGTKPVPFTLLQGRGAVRTTRHGTEDEQLAVAVGQPRIPRELALGKVGRRIWRDVCSRLQNARVLSPLDCYMLAVTCKLWEEYCEDPKAFPGTKLVQLRLYAEQFGMTPPARMKLRDA